MEYYFQTKKMCVGYDGKAVVKDVEIALPKGEILTLIGPNGAGKSTVLKSIAGQLRLLGGVTFLGNELLSEMAGAERAKKISSVFTDRIQTELMTCREVVATGRYPYTNWLDRLSKEDEQVVDEVIHLVQITDICEQDFRKISDGQRQRVLLARAICQEPELLILDEPTSYLDIRHQLEFLSALQELRKKKGLTVIMSLHELELAKRVSDKLLCLKGEYVERYGTPAEIFQNGYITQLFDIPKSSLQQADSALLAYVEQIETL